MHVKKSHRREPRDDGFRENDVGQRLRFDQDSGRGFTGSMTGAVPRSGMCSESALVGACTCEFGSVTSLVMPLVAVTCDCALRIATPSSDVVIANAVHAADALVDLMRPLDSLDDSREDDTVAAERLCSRQQYSVTRPRSDAALATGAAIAEQSGRAMSSECCGAVVDKACARPS